VGAEEEGAMRVYQWLLRHFPYPAKGFWSGRALRRKGLDEHERRIAGY
jgi:hypothetical protein